MGQWHRLDQCRLGTQQLQPRACRGRPAALKGEINDSWTATVTYTYQRQSTLGAWDEDLANYGQDAVSRFGPESRRNEAKILDFEVDGDVGIGDLVFASTYWSLPTRQTNEYSNYMENYKGGAQEGFSCLNDPNYGTSTTFDNCQVPTQFFEYHTNPRRWSEELRLVSKEGGRFHWLTGFYWERTENKSGSTYFMPGLQPDGAAFQSYLAYYGNSMSSLPPGEWYSYATTSDYLQTTEFANISFDLVPNKLTVDAGVVRFSSTFSSYSPYGQFAYSPTAPVYTVGWGEQGEQQGRYQLQDHRQGDGVRRLRPGFSRRRFQLRPPDIVLRERRAAKIRTRLR